MDRVGPAGPKGDKGNPGTNSEPIHPWRWRLLTGWVVGFSLISFFAFRDGRAVDEKIQDERALSIILNCEAQNQRHDQTINVLDQRINEAKRGQTPQRQKEIQASRDYTALLVDALVPKLDCEEEARKRVNPPKGSGTP